MDPLSNELNRRTFLKTSAHGFGALGLGSLLAKDDGMLIGTHHKPKAKRIIYMFQSGAPSQMDLFDPKPDLGERFSEDLPDSIRMGQRITGMTSGQKTLPVAPSIFKFAQHGQSGAWLSELLPHTAKVADDLCIIKSMHTEAINHDPAITFFQTGHQLAGRPSIGSWMSYGLGSSNKDLPTYVVLTSRGTGRPNDQPLYDRLWGSGFISTQHAGVKFRNTGDPVLYLSNPDGVDRPMRRDMLDDLASLNGERHQIVGDPEIEARIAQYEMAFRMQASVPELTDVKGESQEVLDLYGPEVKKPGSYAANCLLARRLAERDVRFIQLFHQGWDHHGGLPKALKGQCSDTDHPTAGLLTDLKQRGMLEDTLLVWGGEFGRTTYCQGKLTRENYGRDHHPKCFSMWMAGAGIKKGITIGKTDDYCYNILEDPIHVHDLNATILHLLGVDHERLTYRFQGRQFRLTDVHGKLIKQALS
ncbi:MAG: DUF1501 domain-containing protein [Akkermansiaceae bacterium]|nr:DUF1501 domain-containing protein [Akkermansiaceae bacterium]MDG1670351.1 DUF1501 domain-containing protein [Akkermansiaceae bacterium]